MTASVVHVIDDDHAVRDSLGLLLESAGYAVRCHANAEAFLHDLDPDEMGCIILDVRMDGMDGTELHAELNRRGSTLPVIYLTGHGTIPMSVQAIKAGAAEFFTKPVKPDELMERVEAAMRSSQQDAQHLNGRAQWRRQVGSLTLREHEILSLALSGQSNKYIARQLGISHRTVELHRSHILQKTGKSNMLELSQCAALYGFEYHAAAIAASPATGAAPAFTRSGVGLTATTV